MLFSFYKIKRNDVIKFLFANVFLCLIIVLVFYSKSLTDRNEFLVAFCWTFSICCTQWLVISLLISYINHKISWIKSPIKKVFIQSFSVIGCSITLFTLVQFLNYSLWTNVNPSQSLTYILQSIHIPLLITLFISLLLTSVGFFKAWTQSVIQAEKLKTEMMTYKYESLRNQINPHFLFNSLNVLSDLVYDDQAMAVKFIRQMSDLFRYVLDSRDKELVPLSEELEFIQSFTFMLKTRFENKLEIEQNIKANFNEYIVPMTIQLLVENAVKHNEASQSNPLKVTIRKNDNYIEVENNLQPKYVGDNSKKTGLKNIIQQYSFFTDKEIEIIPANGRFLVRIPLLKSIEK